MGDKAPEELPGSIVETFVLAIELVGYEIKNGPAQINKVLAKPEIKKKIYEALDKRLYELQKKSILGRPIDADQALAEVTSVFTVDTLDATKAELKKLIEKSPKYQRLKSGLDDLGAKFKASPKGFFYDEAEGLLLIFTVGVMIAGAAGMYIAATGDVDSVTNLAGKIAELPSVTVLGKVDLGLTDTRIEPSQKKYDAGLYARVSKWKAVEKAELKVVVQTKDEKVVSLPVSVETKIQVAPKWFNTVGAMYDPMTGNAKFSLGISGKVDALSVQVKANYAQEEEKTSYGASGGIDYRLKSAPINLTAGASYKRVEEQVPNLFTGVNDRKTTNDVGVNVGLKVEFW